MVPTSSLDPHSICDISFGVEDTRMGIAFPRVMIYFLRVLVLFQAMDQLDQPDSDIEASERLASFLGTLFVKNEIAASDEEVLAAVAERRPNLKGRCHLSPLHYSGALFRGQRTF